jgi:hypothetical protein
MTYLPNKKNIAVFSQINFRNERKPFDSKRKDRLAHQYVEQLEEVLRAAIFGNIGTIIPFQFGALDRCHLAKEVPSSYSENDLISLPQYPLVAELLINGVSPAPFSTI